jgi:uncharacterized protein YbaP (TraB family)
MRFLTACFVAAVWSVATPVHPETLPATSAEPDESILEEVEVTGERPGPRMWRVSKGENVLWVLGTLDPLPKDMKWKSKPVEDVLDEADEVLSGGVSVSADIGPITGFRLYRQWRRVQKNPDNVTLQEAVPAPLYARFEALRNRYAPRDDSMERMQPMFAGGRLFGKAVAKSGLASRNSIQRTVLKLAKKKRVKVTTIELEVEDPSGLLDSVAGTPREAQLVCLETTIARLETDVDAMVARANAWANGDVDALRELPYPNQEAACWEAVSSSPRIKEIGDRARTMWLAAAEAALEKNRTTLALQAMHRLLGPNGVLEIFRAKGYEVEGP